MNDLKLDTFRNRMKGYEAVSSSILMKRMPVIIRVDGRNFSRFTSDMKKPFDYAFARCMQATALRLASDVQNCRIAYHQSDEINLLLTDFRTLNTQTWFDNRVQKICSAAAGLATAAFAEEYCRLFSFEKGHRFPTFDARCFNLPREEVINYFIWRQRDAERNSILMSAQAIFSHKETQGLDPGRLKEMMLQKGVDWNLYDCHFRRGSVLTKEIVNNSSLHDLTKARWLHADAPVFVHDRDFIEKFLREEEVRT